MRSIAKHTYYATGTVTISLIKPNSSKVFYEEVIIPSLSCSNATDFSDFNIGDFNGDGLSDLFFLYYDSPIVYMSTYNNSFSVQVSTNDSYNGHRKIIVDDFNGDKKDQIIIIGKRSSGNNNPYGYQLRITLGASSTCTWAPDYLEGPVELMTWASLS